MDTKRLAVLLFALSLFIVLCASTASAQYETQQTTDFTVSPQGVATADQTNSTGISVTFEGPAGSTGSVTSAVYQGNPQTNSTIPPDTTLTSFIVVSFDVPQGFTEANVTFHYSAADVAGINPPYAIYKYMPATNSYVLLPSVEDPVTQTLTVTLSSPDDQLFAIGGATAAGGVTVPLYLWGATIVVAVVIAVVVAFVLLRSRSKPANKK